MSNPPFAKKIKKELSAHGRTRIDNYYWLNRREDPEVIQYLKNENEYTELVLSPYKELRENIYKEIVGRIKQTDMSVPFKMDGFYYYTRYEEGREYPIYCRKKESLETSEEILLDVNILAEGHSYCEVADLDVSTNNNILAYTIDIVGRRQYTLMFKDLITGQILKEHIPNTSGEFAWANDNKTIFYSIKDAALRPYKILRHALGTEVEKDMLVYHEKDETFITSVDKTKSKKFIIIENESTLTSESWFVEADHPEGALKVIHPRERGLEYSASDYEEDFYILTNWKARNFRLMKTPLTACSKENWKEVIAHREDVLIEDLEIFKNYMVVEERKNGLMHLRIMNWQSKEEYYIDFGETTYVAYLSINPEHDTHILRFGYTSLTTPASTFDFDMNTRTKVLLKQQEIVGGYDPSQYQAERLYTIASDGVKVPISLVYKKGMIKNADNPLLLYGYGSYGVSIDPGFSSPRLSLLDRGFVFAIAHIRGGEDLGRYWYEEGRLLKKKNTFTDFIACVEYLIKEKFTNPEKLFAMGGSAGGLLIGAVVNMRPELFKGVVAAVPFVDVVTTMMDENIPLTTGEYDEWGNPGDKEYYDYILSYSPYDNVESKDYPAMLITTSLHDSQVQYWEPAKWIAKLREVKTDNNVVLLHTNMEAGHGGASGRFEQYKETALNFTFLLSLLEVKE